MKKSARSLASAAVGAAASAANSGRIRFDHHVVQRRRLWASVILFGMVCGVAPGAWAGPYSFTTIDYPGASATNAAGINNAGQIVGGAATPADNGRGWELSGGTFSPVIFPGAPYFCGPVPGGPQSTATSINSGGTVGGFYSSICSTPRFGFTESSGSYTSLSVSPGQSTTILGINDGGVVVGSSYLHTPGRQYSGYIDNGGALTFIDAAGAFSTSAIGINNVGDVVGSYDNNGFLDIGGILTTIDVPGATVTSAMGINNSNVIAGFFQAPSEGYQSFTWNSGVFDTFTDPLGVNGTFAEGINDNGQIVGYYIDGSRAQHGFLADDPVRVPEPAPITLILVGLAAIGLIRRRQSVLALEEAISRGVQ